MNVALLNTRFALLQESALQLAWLRELLISFSDGAQVWLSYSTWNEVGLHVLLSYELSMQLGSYVVQLCFLSFGCSEELHLGGKESSLAPLQESGWALPWDYLSRKMASAFTAD